MSLVGRLEDLSVGEILQIVSLSKRSGLLRLESPGGKANLFIKSGQVMYGARSDVKEGVLGLLAQQGLFEMSQLDPIRDKLEASGDAAEFRGILQDELDISPADMQGALKKRVEDLVYSLFYWEEGTFSFQLVDDESEHPLLKKMLPLFLEEGIGAQFLVMEGARLKDERIRSGEVPGGSPDIEGDWSEYEDKLAVDGQAGEGVEEHEAREIDEFAIPENIPAIPGNVSEIVLLVSGDEDLGSFLTGELAPAGLKVDVASGAGESLAAIQEFRANSLAPYLVMELDAEGLMDGTRLGSLEILTTVWDLGFNLPTVILHRDDIPEELAEKLAGIDTVSTVHYRGEAAASEAAAEIAAVILPERPPEKSAGDAVDLSAESVDEPAFPVELEDDPGVVDDDLPLMDESLPELGADEPMAPADAAPAAGQEAQPSLEAEESADTAPAVSEEAGSEEYYDLEQEFQSDLEGLDLPFEGAEDAPPMAQGLVQNPEMMRLSSYVSELSRPDISGEITLLTLRFASAFTSRAILFLVRKDDIKGLGQFGVHLGESRDADRAVRSLELPVEEDSIFSLVIKNKTSYRGAPLQSETEKRLFDGLGGGVPNEVYLGPIISMGKVAVVLYGDDYPAGEGLEPTDTMDIFLSHAGLALDRAFLEMKLKSDGN
jgi:hypothetical protein